MIVYGCLMEYNKKVGLPVHEMRMKSVSMFNEESGEQSFSVLARCAISDTQRKKVEVMSNYYSNIHTHMEVDEQLRTQRQRASTKEKISWRKKYTAEDSDVIEINSFLKCLIREKVHGISTILSLKVKDAKNSLMAGMHSEPFKRDFRHWCSIDEHNHYFNAQATKCLKFFNTNFGMRLDHIFEEMKHPDSYEEGQREMEVRQRNEDILKPGNSGANIEEEEKRVGKHGNKRVISSSEEEEDESESEEEDEDDREEVISLVTPRRRNKKFNQRYGEMDSENILSPGTGGKRRKRSKAVNS